jgi:hypothetical protein
MSDTLTPTPAPIDPAIAAEKLVAAENALRQASTSEFFPATTVGNRDRLLLASAVCLAISVLGFQPATPITQVGIQLTSTHPWALPAGLASILFYFLVSFCIDGWIARNRWNALVSPEMHALYLTHSSVLREGRQLIGEAIVQHSKELDLSRQQQELQAKRADIRTDAVRVGDSADISEVTASLERKAPDTSILDDAIEKLEEARRAEREIGKLKLASAQAFPIPTDSRAANSLQQYLMVQNIWLIGFPILIGLFSEVIILLKLYSVLRG